MLLLSLLTALLAGGVIYCYWFRKDAARPLPTFRGVRYFNGSSDTETPQVTASEKRVGVQPSPPTPLTPLPVQPNAMAVHMPTVAMDDVERVTVSIEVPPVPPATTASTITIVAQQTQAGSAIIGLDVILADDGADKVGVTARVLWYRDGAPYWNWTAVPAGDITGSPCPTPHGATRLAGMQPLVEETLFNGTGTALTTTTVMYTRRTFPDPTGWVGTASVGPAPESFSLLGAPTIFTDVVKARAQINGMAVTSTLPVNQPADHFYAVYFIVDGATSIRPGGIMQSTVAPYWKFK